MDQQVMIETKSCWGFTTLKNIFEFQSIHQHCDINRFPRKFWWIFVLELWENGHGLYSRPEKICVPASESIASLPHHDQQRQRPIKFLQRGRRKFQPDYCLIPTFTCLCCSIKEGHEINVYMYTNERLWSIMMTNVYFSSYFFLAISNHNWSQMNVF